MNRRILLSAALIAAICLLAFFSWQPQIYNPHNINLSQPADPKIADITLCHGIKYGTDVICGRGHEMLLIKNNFNEKSEAALLRQTWGKGGPTIYPRKNLDKDINLLFDKQLAIGSPDSPVAIKTSNARVVSFKIDENAAMPQVNPSGQQGFIPETAGEVFTPVIHRPGLAKITIYYRGHETYFFIRVRNYRSVFKGNTGPPLRY